MTFMESTFLNIATRAGLFVLTASMALVAWRLVKGPKNADRIIALDLFSVLVVATGTLYSVFSGEAVFLDVAIGYALVAFLGTVAFARYLERSASLGRCDSKPKHEGDCHE
jgi:multicomponent Na+:H+ antiporter subunit F